MFERIDPIVFCMSHRNFLYIYRFWGVLIDNK
jgi:hypothetical protein